MQYTEEELKAIIENHQHWLKKDCDGWKNMHAYLGGANLRDAYLRGANLRDAYLRDANLGGANLGDANLNGTILIGANLRSAYLGGANLNGAYLGGANLRDAYLEAANLSDANLEGANLEGANLGDAILRGAYLGGANLNGANLNGANLEGADFDVLQQFRLGQILKAPMTGYKKTKEGVVITATIPAGAIVFCINGSKCRTNKAHIIDMGGQNKVLHSSYDDKFEYRLLQDIEIENFNLMYNVECASGFHFFRTREEAERYK